MTSVGQAVQALGLEEREGLEAIIVRPHEGRWQHYRLADCSSNAINGDLYIASGLFRAGTVTLYEGRRTENVAQIVWLPFDFDLYNWLNCTKEEVWAYPQTVIDDLIKGLQKDVEEMFTVIGLPIHRLDYTGHGLAVAVSVPPHQPERVSEIKALHKQIVARINRIARIDFADPEVSDAGTRSMRLVPCTNTKSSIIRQTRTIYQREGTVDEIQLLVAAGDQGQTPPTRAVPNKGQAFDADTEKAIVEAVRPCWTSGSRHHSALALAGLFAKAGVPEEQTENIVDALTATAGGDAKDLLKAVHTSYERVRSGLQVQGFTALRGVFPNALADWLDQIAAKVRMANAPRFASFEADAKQGTKPTAEYVEPPERAFTGWIGDYCALVAPTTEAHRAFHLGVSLTMIGAMLGRHVSARYGSDPLYTNLYTVLVGRSNKTKKDTAIKRATRVLTDPPNDPSSMVNHGIHIVTDVGSAQALMYDLQEHTNVLLYITEFSKLVSNARRKGSEGINPTLMAAFDTPTVLHNRSMANPIEARYPYLSMLTGTQPEILPGLISEEDMVTGFANRLFFVFGKPTAPLPLAPALDRVALQRLVTEFWRIKQSYPEGASLEMERSAQDRWCEWYIADWHTEGASPEEDGLRQRHATFIQKIALIYAVCNGAKTVSLEHLENGIAIVAWMWQHVSASAGTWGRSVDGQIEERILTVLKNRGPMKRRDLQMLCRGRSWTSKEFGGMFEWMVRNDTVAVDAFGYVGLPEGAQR